MAFWLLIIIIILIILIFIIPIIPCYIMGPEGTQSSGRTIMRTLFEYLTNRCPK